MNFGRTQTFGSSHSPCDLGKYNYIKSILKKMLPRLVGREYTQHEDTGQKEEACPGRDGDSASFHQATQNSM